jgi:hypothetical protein
MARTVAERGFAENSAITTIRSAEALAEQAWGAYLKVFAGSKDTP